MSQEAPTYPTFRLVITATKVASFAGESSEFLHAAVVAGMSGAAYQPSSLYTVGDEYGEAAPVLAASMELQGVNRRQRLVELIFRVLSPLLKQSLAESPSAPHVSILLPMLGERYARAQRINFQALRRTLCGLIPGLAPDRLCLVPHQLGATAELLRLQRKLAEGKGERAILCGADSLINSLTYMELAEKGSLATQLNPGGLVPGEGAAALLLEREALDGKRGQTPFAHVVGMASVPEVQVGQAALHNLMGAAEALRRAARSAPETLEQGCMVFVGQAQGVADDLEWHQMVRRLWPDRVGSRSRVTMMLGEVDRPRPSGRVRPHRIKLSDATGEVGAASLPMQLAVACEQFRYEALMARFGFPRSRPLMVLENGDYPLRGAICLQPPDGVR